jgi:hypothetical protein
MVTREKQDGRWLSNTALGSCNMALLSLGRDLCRHFDLAHHLGEGQS